MHENRETSEMATGRRAKASRTARARVFGESDKIQRKDEVLAELMGEHIASKNVWSAPKSARG